MSNDETLKRLQSLIKEKEMGQLDRQIAELENQLYELDIDAMQYEVDKGYRSQESADVYLAAKRKKYFDVGIE